MKLVSFLFAALLAVGAATAQTVNYKVTTNDVSNQTKVIVNFEPLHMELPSTVWRTSTTCHSM